MNGRKTKFSENQIKFILMRLKQGYGVNEIARGFKDGFHTSPSNISYIRKKYGLSADRKERKTEATS